MFKLTPLFFLALFSTSVLAQQNNTNQIRQQTEQIKDLSLEDRGNIFEQVKARDLKKVDLEVQRVMSLKNCISDAKNIESLRQCHRNNMEDRRNSMEVFQKENQILKQEAKENIENKRQLTKEISEKLK